jgi:hypothetical protein
VRKKWVVGVNSDVCYWLGTLVMSSTLFLHFERGGGALLDSAIKNWGRAPVSKKSTKKPETKKE